MSPRILSIAGSDSSGGAGIQADLKTITMLGGYGMTAITAVTAQNTLGVHGVETLSADFVGAQIDACVSDMGVDAVKIGMLGSPEIASVVADRLEELACPIVFDPVMVATSGSVLADQDTIAAFERLMALSTLTTPNLPELAALTGREITTVEELEDAARTLGQGAGCAILAKGGHMAEEDRVTDILMPREGRSVTFNHPREATQHTHGTGCTLSAAIATLLGHGQPMEHAVRLARKFVLEAIKHAPEYGSGNGPLGHHDVRKLD